MSLWYLDLVCMITWWVFLCLGSQLDDSCLTSTTAACPAIQHLVLAACFLVGSQGLLALKKLVDLTTLDLSYTFLTDLSPIFEACPRLKVFPFTLSLPTLQL